MCLKKRQLSLTTKEAYRAEYSAMLFAMLQQTSGLQSRLHRQRYRWIRSTSFRSLETSERDLSKTVFIFARRAIADWHARRTDKKHVPGSFSQTPTSSQCCRRHRGTFSTSMVSLDSSGRQLSDVMLKYFVRSICDICGAPRHKLFIAGTDTTGNRTRVARHRNCSIHRKRQACIVKCVFQYAITAQSTAVPQISFFQRHPTRCSSFGHHHLGRFAQAQTQTPSICQQQKHQNDVVRFD